MRKRRQIRLIASTRCMIRSTGTTCSKKPGPAVEQTTAARALMGKVSRASNLKASSDGWNNWRKNCEPKPTDRKRYGGSTFLKRMGRNGRWEYRLSKIEWHRWQRSWYFDTIPHHELMKSIARRVSDAAMLRVVKAWLEMAVEETDGRGNKQRTTVNKDSGKGTPQGAPVSPLLANLYMRRFLLGWKQQGWDQRLQAHIVNYADDFVILCRRKAAGAQAQMAKMMEKLKLEVNQQKTRVCRVPEESFDFLGYTLGRCYRVKTGQAYIGTKPAKKRVLRFCENISQQTDRKTCVRDTEEVIGELNLMLKGWGNYFQLGSVSKAYESVDSHVRRRLRQWLGRKHKIKGRVESRYPDEYLYGQSG